MRVPAAVAGNVIENVPPVHVSRYCVVGPSQSTVIVCALAASIAASSVAAKLDTP
jgi:hypothetical protein